MFLRDYQQSAHDAVVAHLRHSLQPILIDAATGAGKSYIVAALARSMHEISGGKGILCLAPSRELVLQNVEKYRATNNPASIFSASAGEKCLRHPVIFGTPMSVKNAIESFAGQISTIVIDECHGISPTVLAIVEQLRAGNEWLRAVGLTATPYRLGEGYIYRMDPHGKTHGEDSAKNPFFARCVYRVHARELIERGYLAMPVVGEIGDAYDASRLRLNRMNKFDAKDIDAAFVGKGRLTAGIVGEIVSKAKDRQGVMIFASTVAHAEECFDSLPPEISAIVTGKTKAKERARLIARFKARELKYLVNVSVLTTGFDASHVDLIAILRPTESVALLQQIVGRGLRAHDGKRDCLVLDYAQNVERHCPDGDIFNPEISAHPDPKGELIEVECPQCGTSNEFKRSENERTYAMDRYGYCIDAAGERIECKFGELPGHYGRRCQYRNNRDEQCSFRWIAKTCDACGTKNDIAARYCEHCHGELVDPNAKLFGDKRDAISDPTNEQTETVIDLQTKKFITKKGKECLRADFTTPRRRFVVFYHPNSPYPAALAKYREFRYLYDKGFISTVTYKKNPKTGYYRTIEFNRK